MKTPRELLLEKHRHAETKLAALCGEDLAKLARQQSAALEPSRRRSLPALVIMNFWRESIRPWRRAWAGMAAAWIGILTLHLATIDRPATAPRHASTPDFETRMVLAEQKQLLAELLEPLAPPPISRPRPSGPRSDLRREQVIV